ncbi:MAG: LysR family transcriptional regulator, partial [Acidobacteriaceae bacterium]
MENFRFKVFRIVAQHLNFSRAAEELSLSQPAHAADQSSRGGIW